MGERAKQLEQQEKRQQQEAAKENKQKPQSFDVNLSSISPDLRTVSALLKCLNVSIYLCATPEHWDFKSLNICIYKTQNYRPFAKFRTSSTPAMTRALASSSF